MFPAADACLLSVSRFSIWKALFPEAKLVSASRHIYFASGNNACCVAKLRFIAETCVRCKYFWKRFARALLPIEGFGLKSPWGNQAKSPRFGGNFNIFNQSLTNWYALRGIEMHFTGFPSKSRVSIGFSKYSRNGLPGCIHKRKTYIKKQWSYDKALIAWVRSGRTEKY